MEYILFVACLFGIAIFGLWLGVEIGNASKWNYYPASAPKNKGREIMNYPVAFFDDEFGVVIDQAEYHPNRPVRWATVPHGDPCYPFAWYDLPNPPHPQHTTPSIKTGINDYI